MKGREEATLSKQENVVMTVEEPEMSTMVEPEAEELMKNSDSSDVVTEGYSVESAQGSVGNGGKLSGFRNLKEKFEKMASIGMIERRSCW